MNNILVDIIMCISYLFKTALVGPFKYFFAEFFRQLCAPPTPPYAETCFVWNKLRKYPAPLLQNVRNYDPQNFAPNGVKIDQKGCNWTKKGWKWTKWWQ